MFKKIIMFKKSIFLLGLLLFVLLTGHSLINPTIVQAEEINQSAKEELRSEAFFYYFYVIGCPFCAKIETWFEEELMLKFPDLEIKKINIGHGHAVNREIFINLSAENFGITPAEGLGAVPTVFIGNYYLIGIPWEREKEHIKRLVEYCLEYGCISPREATREEAQSIRALDYITLPIIGEINVRKFSFPLLTVMIAAADGFNPCAMWILLFLLALVLKEPSRKRLVTIVGTFILVSGIFYFFLLTAWLKLFLVIGYLRIIQIIIASVALTMGFWQLKSFIVNKAKVCPISRSGGKFRNIIVEKAKKVVAHRSLFFAVIGTAALAVVVNFFEFLCSAGFPAIWTSLLARQGFPLITKYGFILLYVFIFMLDQIIIFTIAFITLKVTKIGEKLGKWVGLIGGILMIVLGLLILFRPEWLVFA